MEGMGPVTVAVGDYHPDALLVLHWLSQQRDPGQCLWRGVCRLADERWLPGLPPVPAAVALLGTPTTQGGGTQTKPQRRGAGLWAGHPRPAQRPDGRDLPGPGRPTGGPDPALPRPVGRLPPVR